MFSLTESQLPCLVALDNIWVALHDQQNIVILTGDTMARVRSVPYTRAFS
jgi:hypothetical protein